MLALLQTLHDNFIDPGTLHCVLRYRRCCLNKPVGLSCAPVTISQLKGRLLVIVTQ